MIQRIYISPEYASLKKFLIYIPSIMDNEGIFIYGGKRNLIKAFTAPDRKTVFVVKRYHVPNFINTFIYSWGVRRPKGFRAFYYPKILQKKDIETPVPVAYIEERTFSFIRKSYFISLECPYSHRLYEVEDDAPEVYEPLAFALAHFVAHMHEQGILHLDFSPGNVLWDKDAEGHYHFSIVDINRMNFGPVSMKKGCKNFARLWGPDHFFELLSGEYASQRHFNVKVCRNLVFKERQKFWKGYNRRHKLKSFLRRKSSTNLI